MADGRLPARLARRRRVLPPRAAARETDNPDQRIAEDLRALSGGTLSLATGLLNAVVTLVSFVGILWSISGPLAIPLAGTLIMIPAYMVWAAVMYSVVGTLITHRIGRPLVALHFEPAALRGGLPLRPGSLA